MTDEERGLELVRGYPDWKIRQILSELPRDSAGWKPLADEARRRGLLVPRAEQSQDET